MYHYVENKEDLRKAKRKASEIALQIQDEVRNNGIGCQIFLVGSGAKNLVTQNEDEPFDFDYNLNILFCDDWGDCKSLKETVRNAANVVLKRNGLGDISDSTSSLTTNTICFKDQPDLEFSIDIGIVTLDSAGVWERLIHDKRNNRYYWNEAFDSKSINDKAVILKKNNHWQEVRDEYLTLKNKYLTANDYDHPSFVCYIEAVNNVYQRWGKR